MIAQVLKGIFDPIIKLDIKVWENFSELGEIRSAGKGEILKHAGKTEKSFRILLEGKGGNLIWKKNNFVCTDLAFEGEVIMDFVSFIQEVPSELEVRLFEDSRFFIMSRPSFLQTMEEGNFGDRVTRYAFQQAYADKQEQQIDLLTKPARTRYLELLKKRPDAASVPLKFMASYLGITPQSLSRIRSESISKLP